LSENLSINQNARIHHYVLLLLSLFVKGAAMLP